MDSTRLATLPVIFQNLTDPRDPRGVRFPFRALCGLVFLGLLARICEMAVLVRWAEAHWDQLREPLGFAGIRERNCFCNYVPDGITERVSLERFFETKP